MESMQFDDVLKNSMRKIAEASKRAVARTEKLEDFSHIAGKESLTDLVGKKLKGRKLLLASNREPYTHIDDGKGGISWYRAAGGLTIALDSMAAACESVWICYGDSEADHKVTDARGKVQVPPANPAYVLKRLKLTPEEVEGYYDGFANETLWPLCHVCYVRPKFLSRNWEIYQSVNRKFAAAIAEEAEPGSIVFLQDYHLCMVAKYLKEKRPDLTTVHFWHIPWPNPEIFRICPWKIEVLEGLLSNDILGFHLRYHASNFMETVGQEVECRLDWDKMQILRNESVTRIRAYPISIDFNAIFKQAEAAATTGACAELRHVMVLDKVKIGLGVDRLDYTKGIPERLDAIDRLFELFPEHVGKVTFVQIGVPSRTQIEDYQQVVARIESRCEEINSKYRGKEWRPVVFLKGHQNFDTLIPFYKLADVCIVSSLHDGMNLVAKEFVSASSNDRGVLVLSRFTGAARELEQALLVNPYDTDSFAEVLHQALTMSPDEQKARLDRMRQTVAENNIFAWAMSILNDVVQLADDSQITGKQA